MCGAGVGLVWGKKLSKMLYFFCQEIEVRQFPAGRIVERRWSIVRAADGNLDFRRSCSLAASPRGVVEEVDDRLTD